MKKFLRCICFVLCVLILPVSFLVGCDNDSGDNGTESDTYDTGDTGSSQTEDSETAPDNGKEVIELNKYLISSWDFCGADVTERLTDKATNGNMVEFVTPVGTGTTVDYGKLTINDGIGNYAMIGNVEGSDIYDLANKTIIFKAKIHNEGGGLVAGILSKENAFDLYFEGMNKNRSITFKYKINSSTAMEQSSTSTPVDEWRVFAVTFDVDREAKTADIRVYRSRSESPSSGSGYERVLEVKLDNIPDNFLVGSEHLYLGKRYDHLGQARGMNTVFAGIKVYNKPLTPNEMALVSFDMDISDMMNMLGETISKAEAVERTHQSDTEWNIFLDALKRAKAVKAEDGAEAIQTAYDALEKLLASFVILTIPDSIGDLTKIRFNNPDIVTPIYSSYASNHGFYDINQDGKMDLIVVSSGQTYTGIGGNCMLAYINASEKKGDTVFEPPILLQHSMKNAPMFSYKTDGSPAFVMSGTLHTELNYQGLADDGIYFSKLSSFKLYDVDGDGLSDAVYCVGSASGSNNYDKNGNSLHTYSASFKWVKNTGSEERPVFTTSAQQFLNENGSTLIISDHEQYTHVRSFGMADWDGDGDLDLIAGGWLNEFYYYENIGTAAEPKFKSKGVKVETESGPMELDCCRYNMINYDWDGDGKDDLIMGSDSGDAIYFRFTGRFNKETGAPIFEDQRNFCTKAEYVSVSSLSRPTACDFDGDGDTDFIVGESAGFLYYIENLGGTGDNTKFAAPVKLTDEKGNALVIKAGYNESLQGTQEAEWGYTVPCACDWDGDGDVDVIVNSVTGRVVWFENIGTATKPQLTQPKPIEVEWEGETLYPAGQWWKPEGKELVTEHRTTPYAIDFNGDGLCDLVMLDHEGYLAFYERYEENGVLKLKQGKRIFVDSKGNPIKLSLDIGGNFGTNDAGATGRIKIAVVDWDGDGMLDIIVGGTLNGNNFRLYRTTKIQNGKYYLSIPTTDMSTGNITGHHNGFTIVDWNGDGKPDIITGTESGYLYYFENKTK